MYNRICDGNIQRINSVATFCGFFAELAYFFFVQPGCAPDSIFIDRMPDSSTHKTVFQEDIAGGKLLNASVVGLNFNLHLKDAKAVTII